MIEKMRTWARALKAEIAVLAAAVRDPRTPWYAKVLGVIIVAYALSPIDLIPDFIPVLGYLDDLLLLPLGIWLVRRMIPADVMAEHRASVAAGTRLPPNRMAAAAIVALWVISLTFAAWWAWNRVHHEGL
ncbi:MAG: DUF1232 domain-containing protein [Hyphomicrobium sp.]|nr:DUF1232 domain-containing protein [Hyphomicrobium sp.]